jgi:hypothetical protein
MRGDMPNMSSLEHEMRPWDAIRTAAEALQDGDTRHSLRSDDFEPFLARPSDSVNHASSSPRAAFKRMLDSRFKREVNDVPGAVRGSMPPPVSLRPICDTDARKALSAGPLATRVTEALTSDARLRILLAVLTSCPVCKVEWTARKSAPTKEAHARKCAKARTLRPGELVSLVQAGAQTACDLASANVGVPKATLLDRAVIDAEHVEVVGGDESIDVMCVSLQPAGRADS